LLRWFLRQKVEKRCHDTFSTLAARITLSDPAPATAKLRLPCDYYSAPASEVRPVFPRWVPLGCGSVSAFILVVLFIAGAFFNGGGSGSLFDFALGAIQGELSGQYAPDVTPAEKAAVDSELSALRANVRRDAIPGDRVFPLLTTLRDVVEDQKVTHDEAQQLIKQLHDINAAKKKR
jgi:hypothetical protein